MHTQLLIRVHLAHLNLYFTSLKILDTGLLIHRVDLHFQPLKVQPARLIWTPPKIPPHTQLLILVHVTHLNLYLLASSKILDTQFLIHQLGGVAP